MKVVRLILGSLFLGLFGCGNAPATTMAASPSVSGGEEPSLVCPNRTRDEDMRALALELDVLQLAHRMASESPSDADAATVFVATTSRILHYQEHDSACTSAGMLEAYSSGCRGGPRTRHDALLPDLARRADQLCSDQPPRAERTLASLRSCGLAD